MSHLSWRDKMPKSMAISNTTVDDLHSVLRETKTNFQAPHGMEKGTARYEIDCDEVYPSILIGDSETARNIKYLKKIGVTHVLNAAEGDGVGLVSTGPSFYESSKIEYLGLPLNDEPYADISQYFNDIADFVENALNRGGKVYVHCVMGISRSSTCVMAYLMIKKGHSAAEAGRLLRQKRNIYPNPGFLQQIAQLDNKLRRAQRAKSPRPPM